MSLRPSIAIDGVTQGLLRRRVFFNKMVMNLSKLWRYVQIQVWVVFIQDINKLPSSCSSSVYDPTPLS